MGERLGKVAQRRAGGRVDLFGEEPDIVGVAAEPLEQVAGLLRRPAAQRQVLRAPEAADAERTLARRGRLTLVGWRFIGERPDVAEIPVQQAVPRAESLSNPAVGLPHP